MKKFLSLVLAVIMTMSLVTISASAAEYDDFTDKDEITHEEAVAVLNRLGIITGYSEGDFRPEGELTRGAAAKIIASLLIGPAAAENLSPTSAPFKDVPLDHTFAGPIAYCSTLKIINGYSDGSFQPGGTLTGYAFSKMLLGALGYDGAVEGFTGPGWNMKVNAIGADANLFDRLVFKGNDAVNREEAAQLALNTIKATLVEYKGGMTITAGDAHVVSPADRVYKTSNQDFARNISADTAANNSEYYTVEFGEEHFVDLKLEHDKHNPAEDDFGRPSNEWSYKKVTIGTFPIAADYTFTEQVAHLKDKDTVKERALGLGKYEVTASRNTNNGWSTAAGWNQTHVFVNGQLVDNLDKIATIADYTDNGATVQVYVDNDDADFISHVVVTQPMLVEVKKVGGDYVSLDLIKADTKGAGFNQNPLDNYKDSTDKAVTVRGMSQIEKLEDVEIDDDGYDVLKDLKAGDKVVVIPVNTNHNGDTWEVARAYVPETASGKLTRVETYDQDANSITVGGTAYKVSQWNKDIKDIDADIIKVTVKDVTLYLDENGCAMLADDVGETSDYMVIGGWSQGLVNNKIVNIVDGWDVSGNPLSLNVGTSTYKNDATGAYQPGDLVKYTNEGTTGVADWRLLDGSNETATALGALSNTKNTAGYYEDLTKIYEVDAYNDGGDTANAASYVIKSSNTRIALKAPAYEDIRPNASSTVVAGKSGANILVKAGVEKDAAYSTSTNLVKGSTFYFANDVKFIYVDFETNGSEVERIEVLKGAQNVTTAELLYRSANHAHAANSVFHSAQAYVDKNGEVKAVVIKTQSNNAMSNNLMFIREHWGEHIVEEATNGKKVYGYTVAMMNADGSLTDAKNIYCDKNLTVGTFATYAEGTLEGFDNYYTVKEYDSLLKTTSVMRANVLKLGGGDGTEVVNKWLLRVDDGTANVASTTAFTVSGTPLVNPEDATAAPLGERAPGAAWIMSNERGTSDTIADGQDAKGMLRFTSRTKWVDMSDGNNYIDSLEDLKDFVNVDIRMIVNDNKESDSFREVALAIVYSAVEAKDRAEAPADLAVNVSPAKPGSGYAAGTELTLTASVSNLGKLKNVNYVWFVDNDADGKFSDGDTRIGGNTSSVTVTAGATNVYVTVTNTDSDKTITSSSSTVAVPNASLEVDSNSVTYPVTVVLENCLATYGGKTSDRFVINAGAASEILTALTADPGYELPTGTVTGTEGDATAVITGTNVKITATGADTITLTADVAPADLTGVSIDGTVLTTQPKDNVTRATLLTGKLTGFVLFKAEGQGDWVELDTTDADVMKAKVKSDDEYLTTLVKVSTTPIADADAAKIPAVPTTGAESKGTYAISYAAKAADGSCVKVGDNFYLKTSGAVTATIKLVNADDIGSATSGEKISVTPSSTAAVTTGAAVVFEKTANANDTKTIDITFKAAATTAVTLTFGNTDAAA